MRIFVWLIRAFIFFTLFAFALNNQQAATVHWFFGVSWHGPMVFIVLLICGLLMATSAQTSEGTRLRTEASTLPDIVKERSDQGRKLEESVAEQRRTVDPHHQVRVVRHRVAGNLLQQVGGLVGAGTRVTQGIDAAHDEDRGQQWAGQTTNDH